MLLTRLVKTSVVRALLRSSPPVRPPFARPERWCRSAAGRQVSPEPEPEPDALPRYPTRTAQGALRLLDYVGTASFAQSGAMVAGAAGMDLLGATLVGTVTAIGGGTIRDALILSRRPFWTVEPEYVYLALATAASTFALAGANPGAHVESAVEVAVDAVGVGAFCVIGAQNGVRARLPTLMCVVCGLATATFGGVVRDVLCGRPVRILHSHADVYASTAIIGASTFLLLRAAGAPPAVTIAAGVGIATVLRLAAWAWGVRLPVWPDRLVHNDHDTQPLVAIHAASVEDGGDS